MSRIRSAIVAAIVGVGMATMSGQALMGSAGATAPRERQLTGNSKAVYLVQLADAPLAKLGLETRSTRSLGYQKTLRERHRDILAKVPGARKLYDYSTVFNGFAVELDGTQAQKLARTRGVLKVWKNEQRKLDTISTPTFLGLTGRKGVWQKQFGGAAHAGEGVIVGAIDSGFWPESPSFTALPEPRPDAHTIKTRWHGHCDAGKDANPKHNITCNNKVIGARYYNKGVTPLPGEFESPRDFDGHGSHTTSTAAGNSGVAAVINGSSQGLMSGIAPAARIAVYKVCWEVEGAGGCSTVDSIAAIDQAVADGVDVINFSVSGSTTEVVDPVEIAFYNAAAAGVFIAASAGNAGPQESTVAHNSPWVTTVAASTHGRASKAVVTLGNGAVVTGAGNGEAVPSHPLIRSEQAGKEGADPTDVRLCAPGALDPVKVAGKVIACARGTVARTDKSKGVKAAGGVGMVLYNTSQAADDIAADLHWVPTVHVKLADAETLKTYASRKGATATLSKGEPYQAEAPEMAVFSSAGPALAGDGDLLKPDITAPGVDVIAAVAPPGNDGALFASYQGTSMSSPHIAGLAALVKGKHPKWQPTWIRSALMTTARQNDNAGNPIRRDGKDASPLDFGAGHVDASKAFDPGLVYDSTPREWTSYICALGQGQLIDAPCSDVEPIDPSDLNYPSIAIGDLAGKQAIVRTVTNATRQIGIYTATVRAPKGVRISVRPSVLTLGPGRSQKVRITATRTDAEEDTYGFGSLAWKDGLGHVVRSPIVLRPVRASFAREVSVQGGSGEKRLEVRTGYAGALKASATGLVAAKVTELALSDPDGSSFPTDRPATNSHVGKVTLEVPASAAAARFATFDKDYASLGEGADIDLFLYRKESDGSLTFVRSSAAAGSNESVTMTQPGTYELYADLYALPAGVTSATVKPHHWVVDGGSSTLTVDPASQTVTSGGRASLTMKWRGLAGPTPSLGVVRYSDGSRPIGMTLVTGTR